MSSCRYYTLYILIGILPILNTYGAGPKNIYNTDLTKCSDTPKTGYFRDGFCNTGSQDAGTHVVCARVNDKFLSYSKSRGNDLVTPRGNFPGLKDGDYWCLCALRWLEAFEANDDEIIPKINLSATHVKMLNYTSLENLVKYNINP